MPMWLESRTVVDTQMRCKFCNQSVHGEISDCKMRKGQCLACGKNCLKCEGKNHFQAVCKQKSSKEDSWEETNSIRVG